MCDSPHPDIERVLISRERIAERVAELGREIARDYAGRDLVLVGVLKGCILFLADLARAIAIPHRLELVQASSYGRGVTSSGQVVVAHDSRFTLEARDVLIVEDILDSGLTSHVLFQEFAARKARGIELCVLLAKDKPRVSVIRPRYVGFEIEDHFVVGYGLDYNEHYRHLDYVGILKKSVYQE